MSDANKLFDDLFTGDSNVVPINRQQATADTDAEPADTEGDTVKREWYVVQNGVQVGPLIVAEVEERWATREINQDTFVWKPTMGEWAAIADTQELLYLITNRPQTSPKTVTYGQSVATAAATEAEAATGSGDGATDAAPQAAAQPIGRLSYGGQVQSASQQVEWRPSAAKELAALVESEMVAQTEVQPTSAGPAAPASATAASPEVSPPAGEAETAPGIAGVDLFTPAVTPSLQTMPQFGQTHAFSEAHHSRAPHAAFAQEQWTLPATPHAGGGGYAIRPIHLVVVVIVAAVISLAAVVVGALMRGGGPSQQLLATGPAPQTATPTAAPSATTATGTATAKAPVATAAKAPPPKPAPTAEAKPYVPPAPKPTPATTTKPYVPPKPAPARTPRPAADDEDDDDEDEDEDDMADVFTPKPSGRKTKLTVNDIVKGVKEGQSKITQCIRRVQRGRDLPPGKYKLLLSWQIRSNGAVTSPKVKGPAAVMATSLPSCFALGMRRWKFPPSKKGAPVRNFPFGPFTIH